MQSVQSVQAVRTTNNPDVDELHRLFNVQKAAWSNERYPSLAVRLDRIARLHDALGRHSRDLIDAISTDFGHRSAHETVLADLLYVELAVREVRQHLRKWMTPGRVRTHPLFWPGKNRLLHQPLGVVGIIGAWNYPLQLTIVPAISALAAGNRVMIKPSELTPHFNQALKIAFEGALDEGEIAIVSPDADVSTAFLQLPLGHLLFTGSTRVGRIVAEAAARNLTPVTLELGGKSPAILDADCDLSSAAERIAFGKLFNSGQTCIAPDYVLLPRHLEGSFVEAFQHAVAKLYPSILENPDYTSIVSNTHHQRLAALVEDARAKGARIVVVNPAGESAVAASRKFLPTIVLDANDTMDVMQSEIFGPVLPILAYDTLDEAVDYINAHDHPLALYWFGNNPGNRDLILKRTHSGGVTINDCLLHQSQPAQPFGGVGKSGYGAYHGEWGFQTFSKAKPVFYQSRLNATGLIRPPYGRVMDHALKWFTRS